MSNAVRKKSQLPGFQLAYTTTGGPPVIVWKKVGATAVKAGDSLVITSSLLTIGLTNSPQLFGVAAAGGAPDAMIPVYAADTTNVFMGRPSGDATALDFPMECDIEGATGAQLVNENASTEDVLQLLGYVPTDDATDDTDHPRVFFQIKRSQYNDLLAGL